MANRLLLYHIEHGSCLARRHPNHSHEPERLGGIGPMHRLGPAHAFQPLGRPRPYTLAPVHLASAIRHGGRRGTDRPSADGFGATDLLPPEGDQ